MSTRSAGKLGPDASTGTSGKSALMWLSSIFVSRNLGTRDIALDALRGLMVLGMILVNHPAPGEAIFAPLSHAAWHGWTLADTIFPGFLFAVGVSIRLVLGDTSGVASANAALIVRVLRRTLLLLVFNFLLVNFPYYFAGTIYLTGTLASIAWCYLIVAMVTLRSGWRAQTAALVMLLATQWALYAFLPLPAAAPGTMLREANAAGYIDQMIFRPVFGADWRTFEDGFVLLPLLGAVASTMLGVLAGHWLRRPGGTPMANATGLFAVGLTLCLAGSAWHALFPVNKSLWTGSYVLLMGGIAMQLYAAFQWACGTPPGRTWLQPMRVVGVNALFFYLFAQSLQRLLVFGRVPAGDGSSIRLRTYLYETFFRPWVHGELGSFVFALTFMTFCYVVVAVMYRKRIFVKV